MEKEKMTKQEEEIAQRETEEIVEVMKDMTPAKRATLFGFAMGLQYATAEKAG